MKKSFVQVLSIVSALSLLFISCAVSPDQMLDDFNKGVYKDHGNGVYTTENGSPNVSTSLIELPTYGASINGCLRIDVSRDFFNYKWTLVDDDANTENSIAGGSILYIYPSVLNLKVGGNYSLKLVVENIDGILFTDSAKLIVT